MIKVNVTDKKITITGHAGYDEYGRDIVCASASSIAITTINAILSFDSEAINYEEKKDELIINVLKKDEITNKLLNNMISLFKELASQYKENIKVIGG